MPTPSHDTPPATDRSLTVIAAAVALALVAMAAWFVAQGGPWGGLVHHDNAPAATGRFTVNVNTAEADELAQLPGIGPAGARRIVDYRRDHGPFTSIDAILDVPDIGPATLEAIRPHLRPITISGASP
jgi:competence ComEA-like helix-hairpin-helix protein